MKKTVPALLLGIAFLAGCAAGPYGSDGYNRWGYDSDGYNRKGQALFGPAKKMPDEISLEMPPGPTLTLSQQQLLSLDWNNTIIMGAQVIDKRAVSEKAVEFDIRFPSNGPGYRSLDYVSCGRGGLGTLVGVDVRDYESFALKFTLVSIDGQTSELKEKVVVGALIGLTGSGSYSDYGPVTLSLASPENSAVGTTPMETEDIFQIGFHIHMENPEEWNPKATVVTLRVEPADGTGNEETQAKETDITPDNEIIACAKCNLEIGALKLHFDYKGKTVCAGCYAKLMGKKYQKKTIRAAFN
jgi:hypothetical protein